MATAIEQAKIAARMKELQKVNKQCFNCATLVGLISLMDWESAERSR